MEEQQGIQPVFDKARQISVTLRARGGDKTLTLRYPTDEEWILRQGEKKITVKSFTDGSRSSSEAAPGDADVNLVKKIVQGEAAASLDRFEANVVLQRLSRAESESVELEGGVYSVVLRVPGGATVHRLKMPTFQEAYAFDSEFLTSRSRRNRQDYSVNLQAGAEIYKSLFVSAEGYPPANGSGPTAGIPIVHQVAVVQAVMEEFASLRDGGEGNF